MLFHSCLKLAALLLSLLGQHESITLKNIADVRSSLLLLDYAASNLLHHLLLCEKLPYKAVRQFFESAQAATWIEAVLVLQGGVGLCEWPLYHILGRGNIEVLRRLDYGV
jgi:hypothetical protein